MVGILQQWIDPKGPHNVVYQVIWSPEFCIIEKRTNIYKFEDPQIDFYDKIVTYEGSENMSTVESLHCSAIVKDI